MAIRRHSLFLGGGCGRNVWGPVCRLESMRPSFQGRSPERLAPRLQETKQGCGVAFWKGLLGVPDRDSEKALSLAFPGKRNHLALFGTSIFHRCGNDGLTEGGFSFLNIHTIYLRLNCSPTYDIQHPIKNHEV